MSFIGDMLKANLEMVGDSVVQRSPGAYFDVQELRVKGVVGSTAQTITTLTTTTITSTALVINSTAAMTFQIGAVGLLQIDDAAISGFAGASGVAGQNAFIETQDGGVAVADTAGPAGATFSYKSGDGSAAGADGGANPVSGAGGAVNLTGGAGGNTPDGTGDGGAGGTVTLVAGAGGTSSGGAAGKPGKVKVSAGLFEFTNSQTIDMSGADVILTLVPGTPSGTLITSNVIFIDANTASDGVLTLPPEADADGLVLLIANEGGEDILIRPDGTVNEFTNVFLTIGPRDVALVTCDGSTWTAGNASNKDPGAEAMGRVDFNAVGTGGMTITIGGIVYQEAGAEDFPNGVWTNGVSAANSAVSLVAAIAGDTRTNDISETITAIIDTSGDGATIFSTAADVSVNYTLVSSDGTATVSAGTLEHGEMVSNTRSSTYEHTVNDTDVLAGEVSIPIRFAAAGFSLDVRTSTGAAKAVTDLVTIQTSPNRIRLVIDGGTNVAATDVINLHAWS